MTRNFRTKRKFGLDADLERKLRNKEELPHTRATQASDAKGVKIAQRGEEIAQRGGTLQASDAKEKYGVPRGGLTFGLIGAVDGPCPNNLEVKSRLFGA